MSSQTPDADVIVVGAGPAGSVTAHYLAQSGLKVVVLEKSVFPREKVCGDGLTPRAVRELIGLGLEPDPEKGWIRNRGLRLIGGGASLEIPWPDLGSFPGYGLVRPRKDFDEVLALSAQEQGAELRQGCTVTGPVLDDAGRIVGVTVREAGRDPYEVRARLVVAADGNSARLPLAMGMQRREDRPMGVAVRAYFTSPRHDDDWLESWVELWEGEPGRSALLPGYGWVFGVGDGTSNVGLGVLNSSGAFGKVDYRDLLKRWAATMPADYGFTPENMTGPIRGAALPMGFNRTPHYSRGLVLVGDAGGMVNPFNGEGIAYAMESGRIAAEVIVQALARPDAASRERALIGYPRAIQDAWGGYFTLGRVFVKAIGHPQVMRIAAKYALPQPVVMKFAVKMLANLTDPRGGDAMDRVINGLSKIAPTS